MALSQPPQIFVMCIEQPEALRHVQGFSQQQELSAAWATPKEVLEVLMHGQCSQGRQ